MNNDIEILMKTVDDFNKELSCSFELSSNVKKLSMTTLTGNFNEELILEYARTTRDHLRNEATANIFKATDHLWDNLRKNSDDYDSLKDDEEFIDALVVICKDIIVYYTNLYQCLLDTFCSNCRKEGINIKAPSLEKEISLILRLPHLTK